MDAFVLGYMFKIYHLKQLFIMQASNTELEYHIKSKTYADLMTIVGNNHLYQKLLVCIFIIACCISSSAAYGNAYFFNRKKLQCKQFALTSYQCQQKLCSQDPNNISRYIQKDGAYTIADQFGPFYCEQYQTLIYFRISYYLGCISSLILFYFTDNIGRKKTFIFSQFICLLASLIIMLSQKRWQMSIGQILLGVGTYPNFRFSILFLSQVVTNINRQKYGVIVLFAYSAFIFFIVLAFYYLQNWRIVYFVLILLPTVLLLILLIWFVSEPPMLLIKYNQSKAVQTLNRIAKLNNVVGRVTIEDIRNVVQFNREKGSFKNIKVSPFDLFKYKSLRHITIKLFFLSVAKVFLNWGPFATIQKFGFEIYVNGISIGVIECFAAIFAYPIVHKIKRKKLFITVMGISTFLYFALIFISFNQKQRYSFSNVTQLMILVVNRGLIILYFSVSQIYFCQIYPTRIRGIGVGMGSAFSSASILFCFLSILQLEKNGYNSMVLICIICFIGLVISFTLPETLNKPLKDQIDQIQFDKNIIKLDQNQPDQQQKQTTETVQQKQNSQADD